MKISLEHTIRNIASGSYTTEGKPVTLEGAIRKVVREKQIDDREYNSTNKDQALGYEETQIDEYGDRLNQNPVSFESGGKPKHEGFNQDIEDHYKHLKSKTTDEVLKMHRGIHRVTHNYSARDAGGKEGMISGLLRSKFGHKKVDAHFKLNEAGYNGAAGIDPNNAGQFKGNQPGFPRVVPKIAPPGGNNSDRAALHTAASTSKQLNKQGIKTSNIDTQEEVLQREIPLNPEIAKKLNKKVVKEGIVGDTIEKGRSYLQKKLEPNPVFQAAKEFGHTLPGYGNVQKAKKAFSTGDYSTAAVETGKSLGKAALTGIGTAATLAGVGKAAKVVAPYVAPALAGAAAGAASGGDSSGSGGAQPTTSGIGSTSGTKVVTHRGRRLTTEETGQARRDVESMPRPIGGGGEGRRKIKFVGRPDTANPTSSKNSELSRQGSYKKLDEEPAHQAANDKNNSLDTGPKSNLKTDNYGKTKKYTYDGDTEIIVNPDANKNTLDMKQVNK